MLKTSIVVAGLLISTPVLAAPWDLTPWAVTEADYYYNPYTGGQSVCAQGGNPYDGADTCVREMPSSTPIRRIVTVMAVGPSQPVTETPTPLRTVAKVRAVQHYRMHAKKPVHKTMCTCPVQMSAAAAKHQTPAAAGTHHVKHSVKHPVAVAAHRANARRVEHPVAVHHANAPRVEHPVAVHHANAPRVEHPGAVHRANAPRVEHY